MTEEFSLERYREIVLRAQKNGYWLPTVSQVGVPPLTARRFLLIRHDVDISVSAAYEMAVLESRLNLATSYYIRLHCPFYNVFEQDTLKQILEMRSMGHEIGFHYEALFFEQMGRDPLEGILADIEIFEKLLGQKIVTISQHLPSMSRVYPELWDRYIDAYQPMLVRDIPYFGDSGRTWREGCILEKIGKYDRMHTLIHPAYWTHWRENWEDNLRAHGESMKARIDADLSALISQTRQYLAEREELDRKRAARYGSPLTTPPG
jgi:hypothetical protein